MRLVAGVMAGPTVQQHGMWRHPETENRFLDAASYEELARLLERGRFDCVFFADQQGIPEIYGNSHVPVLEQGGQLSLLDPLPLLAIMGRVTTHLGLGATLSATHLPPYLLARSLATLDLLSQGRAAWNVVTSASVMEARNFGSDEVASRLSRYDRADEVLEACDRLWNSWDDDALVMNKSSGRFVDGAKVRAANYAGTFIRTKGPLTVPRSPQGQPVIMQAGASERGREFAARWAEMIFTVQDDTAAMIDFYRDIKTRMGNHGREPHECAILVSIDVIAAETESIAREKQAYINEHVTEEYGFVLVSGQLGFDVTTLPLDAPISDIQLEAGSRGAFDIILRASKDQNLTLRQAARQFAISAFTPQIVGTGAQVADRLQAYFEAGACDGFIVNPSVFPGTYEQMVRLVIPELQSRGLFRKEYRHRTLRQTIQTAE